MGEYKQVGSLYTCERERLPPYSSWVALRISYNNVWDHPLKNRFLIQDTFLQGTNGKTFCFQLHPASLLSTDEGNTGLFCNSCQYLLNTLIPDSVPFILCITSLQTQKNAGGRHRCYLCLLMRKARLGEMK